MSLLYLISFNKFPYSMVTKYNLSFSSNTLLPRDQQVDQI